MLPALFLKKPWYPCPFEILAEAQMCLCSHSFSDQAPENILPVPVPPVSAPEIFLKVHNYSQ
jgi:hypothetical protein